MIYPTPSDCRADALTTVLRCLSASIYVHIYIFILIYVYVYIYIHIQHLSVHTDEILRSARKLCVLTYVYKS